MWNLVLLLASPALQHTSQWDVVTWSERKGKLAVILPPLVLHFRSQQLIFRNAARQNCSVGEQGAACTKQGALESGYNNNNLLAFQLIAFARYLLGVPEP